MSGSLRIYFCKLYRSYSPSTNGPGVTKFQKITKNNLHSTEREAKSREEK
jgi:hypothetical protein